MNKKIFTLLAGAMLCFAALSSVKAQDFAHAQRLRVGEPVNKLKVGPNSGFYYLAVDSIIGGSSGIGDRLRMKIRPDSVWTGSAEAYVLFMGKAKDGRNRLFIDGINGVKARAAAGQKWAKEFSNNTPSNAEVSASALWCVNIQDDPEREPVFDFTNKLHETLLDVDVYSKDSWKFDDSKTSVGASTNWRMSGINGDTIVPGGISGWEFSETYATVVNQTKPLVSYLDETRDTVAVLCIADPTVWESPLCIKIAAADEVRQGKVKGMLMFSLREALPFALNATDINTALGRKASGLQKLFFDPDVDPKQTNPFTMGLEAEHLVSGDPMVGMVDTTLLTKKNDWDTTTVGNISNRIGLYDQSVLDFMGYLKLKNDAGKYLYVDTNYYKGNEGGDHFLKFNFSDLPSNSGSKKDQLMFGQYVWRLVYYPSGDSIYINPFKAVYKPIYDPELWHNGADSLLATGAVTQQRYTFAAVPDTIILDGMQAGTFANLFASNPELMKTARLRPNFAKINKRDVQAPLPYKYVHRLYVSIQSLDGGRVVTLHSNHSGDKIKDSKINTHINYDVYAACNPVNSNRTSIEPDLYLIRNEKGQYLQVALNSAHDSASWVYLEKHVHPEILPSFQWIVEKKYRSSDASPINIINREFGYVLSKDNLGGNAKKGQYGLAFMDIQMTKDQDGPFKPRVKNWSWNKEVVNAKVVKFEDVKDMKAEKAETFIKLPKKYKSDPNLGYQWIDPDTSIVNLYALKFISGYNDTKYISLGETFNMGDYPKTDTLLYTKGDNCYTIGYFRLDTINTNAGYYKPYGYGVKGGKEDEAIWKKNQVADLVQLKRQPYRIVYENPFKYSKSTLCVSNGKQGRYALSSKEIYNKYFGKPVFFLRDMYMSEDGEKDFALVQAVDTLTIMKSGGGLAPNTLFYKYLKDQLGGLAEEIMKNLRVAGEFNPGLFVADVDQQMLTLKYTYRPRIPKNGFATFRLKKDNDPIYRRFNTEAEGNKPGDEPETVKFFTTKSEATGKDYLFENTGTIQKNYYSDKKNYLGLVSSNSFPNAKTAIYVDTAYVNRGTGYIKPQYMLMVRPQIEEESMACDENGEMTIKVPGYRRGMYLINATDSAMADKGTAHENDYLWRGQWKRLVFTDAIHANDALYILGNVDVSKFYVANSKKIDLKALDAASDETSAAPRNGKVRKIDLGNNYHKDCVFSFRLYERISCPQKGRRGDFYIESETTDRGKEPIIKPYSGGWIKIQNGVPVISRTTNKYSIIDGELFNVEPTDEEPVSNVEVPTVTDVKVLAENGSVTILNAAGKKVVISNVLGQTVANTVLTSDRATIAAPQGVVVVAIEGEEAVKALVK